jgi:hypothetical protein
MPHSIRARPSQVRILDVKSPLLHLDKRITTRRQQGGNNKKKRLACYTRKTLHSIT